MPDTVANELHDMGLISDGDASTMWGAVQAESNTARTIAREERSQGRLAVRAEKFTEIETLSEVQAFDQFLRRQRKQEVMWILTYLACRHSRRPSDIVLTEVFR